MIEFAVGFVIGGVFSQLVGIAIKLAVSDKEQKALNKYILENDEV